MIVKKNIRTPYFVIVEQSEDNLLSIELVIRGNVEGTYGYCDSENGFDIWSKDRKECCHEVLKVYCRFEQFISDSIELEETELLPKGLVICWVGKKLINIPETGNLIFKTKDEAINHFSYSL